MQHFFQVLFGFSKWKVVIELPIRVYFCLPAEQYDQQYLILLSFLRENGWTNSLHILCEVK